MDKKNSKKKILFKIFASLLLCLSLFCSVFLLGKSNSGFIDLSSVCMYWGVAVFLLCIYEGMTLLYKKHQQTKTSIAISLSFIGIMASSGVLVYLSRFSVNCFIAAGIMFFIAPTLKIFSSIIFRKNKKGITLNVIIGILDAFLLFLICVSATVEEKEIIISSLVGAYMLVSSLIKVFLLVLSDFNSGLLTKIIRKTYAGEIIFGLLILIISFSIAFLTLEEDIKTFGDALWYCFAIVTTIGFGDYAATTILGRILSIMLGLYGIIVVAIVTSIIVNFYNEIKVSPTDGTAPSVQGDVCTENPKEDVADSGDSEKIADNAETEKKDEIKTEGDKKDELEKDD